jgi:hypothetical protein
LPLTGSCSVTVEPAKRPHPAVVLERRKAALLARAEREGWGALRSGQVIGDFIVYTFNHTTVREPMLDGAIH